jgi:copper(I)-binding protein
VVALLLSASACSSASGSTPEITVTDARVAVDGDPAGAAIYLTVHNDGDADDQLTGASTAEGSGMLHESVEESGRASMRMLSEMEVPAGGELVLEPGGAHLMIAVPEGQLGDRFDLTLTFDEAGDVVVPVQFVSADEVLG